MNSSRVSRAVGVGGFVCVLLAGVVLHQSSSAGPSGGLAAIERFAAPLLPFGAVLLAVLVGVAFFAGVGITTIGPGGIFLTIALYALTPLPPGTIAGTAQTTFIATGLVGTLAYVRSGELASGTSFTLTALLSGASILGALTGAMLNASVSRALFGLLLGALASFTGLVIVYRERRGFMPLATLDAETARGRTWLAALGFVLGGFSGLLGVGGPVIAVPALVLVGVPMLHAIAVAQVQSIFIAAFASLGYLAQGAVSLPLAALVGLPLVVGVLAGWRVAHLVDPNRLKVALGGVLLLVGPYLAL